ncbi:MAG: hypothetical protein E7181_01785 [Erysipelotrichaceae bacterium]|nr:hypothetical protein [Erysipelotrichaceae bacterium]
MKKKYLSTLLIPFLLSGCNNAQTTSSEPTTSEPTTSSEPISSSEEELPLTVNIIMAAATVPPVMSALDSLANNGRTYAFIERGKTYSGIEETSFINIGFDPTVNNASGVTNANFVTITNYVKEIYKDMPNAHYNFYTVDYKPWAPVKVASDVKMNKDQFTVFMVEDGTATYQYAERYYQSSFKTQSALDDYYEMQVKEAYDLFDKAMLDSSNIDDIKNSYVNGYHHTFALVNHPNFVHLVQDKVKLGAKLSKHPNSKINQLYGLNGGIIPGHVRYKSISERVNDLSSEDRAEYLKLMFGEYEEEAERLLNRTTLDDKTTSVPNKKLIFIGGRVRQSSANLVPTIPWDDIPTSYNDITPELHQVFLNESDYKFVIDYLNDVNNYEESWKNADQSIIDKIKEKAFRYYIDYTYNLKITYRLYGDEYDVLFKGHPAETFDAPNKWGGYNVTVGEVTYNFNLFMHDLAYQFHSLDSEGKYVGVLPGGVAAENLAYLGVDTYLCGLASSTYTGYEKSSPILYVLNNTNDDIRGDIAINQRYIDDELIWEKDDETIETIFLNYGNRYNVLKDYYKELSDNSTDPKDKEDFLVVSNNYQTRFNDWVKATSLVTSPEGASIDNIGRIIFTNKQIIELREGYLSKVDTYIANKDIASLSEEDQENITLLFHEAKATIYSTFDLYELNNAFTDLQSKVNEYFN